MVGCVRCVVWVYCDLPDFTISGMGRVTRTGHWSREVRWEWERRQPD